MYTVGLSVATFVYDICVHEVGSLWLITAPLAGFSVKITLTL